MSKMSILTTVTATIISAIAIAGAAEVYLCGPDTVNAASSTAPNEEATPLLCSLTSQEQRDRREDLIALATKAISKKEELDDGYLLTFQNGYGKEIIEFIELERACCPFFDFALTFSSNNGPITLAITGPKGSKAFSSELFNLETGTPSKGAAKSTEACCVLPK